MRKTYIFIGKESGIWFLDLKNGKGATGKGEPSQPADATLTMDSDNFFAMFSGAFRFSFEFILTVVLLLYHLYNIYMYLY